MSKTYQESLLALEEQKETLKVKDNRLSLTRLASILTFLLLLYQFLTQGDFIWLIVSILSLLGFLFLIKLHETVKWKLQFTDEKKKVVNDEISFQHGDLSPFVSGEVFIDPSHPFSYDLDFFGDHSIFRAINRTGTFLGKENLAEHLLNIQSNDAILRTQEAVKELSPHVEWRQDLHTLARMQPDNKENYEGLIKWSKIKPLSLSFILKAVCYLFPTAIIVSSLLYLTIPELISGNIIWLLFLIDLGILGSFFKKIKGELTHTTKIEKVLKQYSMLLREIEDQSFNSDLLKEQQNKLITQNIKASKAIHELSLLFGRMEHVQNVFASPILNGFLLYHIYVLQQLSSWRKRYGNHIKDWLTVIATFETLNSLANFSYNRPEFVFPTLNEEKKVDFEDLGHPLIIEDKAITNSISFSEHPFFILTGSNMSGKSTFLRAIGTNMSLAGIGAPVFASKANVHPLPIMISMRQSDSLADSESLFFAEVKRLQSIMKTLENGPCFVLLDEILRGTNSDDKRIGTMEVVRKMATKGAIGGIATHDLEVCNVAEEHPDLLTNKRFEVAIVNDELVFDYKLQDGICENKSASFIMKKMGVI